MIGAKHFRSCKQKCLGVSGVSQAVGKSWPKKTNVGCGATNLVWIPSNSWRRIFFKPHMKLPPRNCRQTLAFLPSTEHSLGSVGGSISLVTGVRLPYIRMLETPET